MTRVRISMMAAGACTLIALGAGACGDITENGDSDKNDNGNDARNAAEVHDDPASLDGRTFVSTEITTQGRMPGYLERAKVELGFEKGASRFTGDVGCNGMFGEVSAAGGTLSVDGVGRTEMACEGPVMRQEEWLVDLLESEPSWELTDDGRLRISSDGTELLLAEKSDDAADGPAALRDVTWKLSGVAEAGAGPDGTARHSRAMEKTELIFAEPRDEGRGGDAGRDDARDDKGSDDAVGPDDRRDRKQPGQPVTEAVQVQGTGGCNQFGGRATVRPETDGPGGDDADSQGPAEYDGTIEFGAVTSTMKACSDDEVMRVEKELLTTLDGTVPYTVSEDSLTLHGSEYELTFTS